METILVTGGAGFIGSNFIRYVQEENPAVKIINLDKLTYAGHQENLDGLPHSENYQFVQGDICDQSLVEDLLRESGVDTIVHFAAESHVDRSIMGPAEFVRTNINGTFSLLEAARKIWLEESRLNGRPIRFHHVSTDEVFGSLTADEPAFTEKTQYSPNSPYSASKASSDHLVRAYYHTYGLPITISNCSNNYGPYQFPEKLIPVIIMNAVQGKPLPIYGDGQQVRDWLYVGDHCDAIYKIIVQGKLGETYNIGGNNQPTNLEIVEQVCSILDEVFPQSKNLPHSSLMTFVKDRPGHDRRYAMDISKIHAELGWSPRENLKTGLEKTIQWYLDHSDWLTAINSGSDFQSWLNQNYNHREEYL